MTHLQAVPPAAPGRPLAPAEPARQSQNPKRAWRGQGGGACLLVSLRSESMRPSSSNGTVEDSLAYSHSSAKRPSERAGGTGQQNLENCSWDAAYTTHMAAVHRKGPAPGRLPSDEAGRPSDGGRAAGRRILPGWSETAKAGGGSPIGRADGARPCQCYIWHTLLVCRIAGRPFCRKVSGARGPSPPPPPPNLGKRQPARSCRSRSILSPCMLGRGFRSFPMAIIP